MNIKLLEIEDFNKCSNIWDMEKQKELADKFYNELLNGNRITYICKDGDKFVAEISLVKEMNDTDYTIPNQRIYVSHLVVKQEYRKRGIGRKLVEFITDKAKELGYSEAAIGVDTDNHPALRLYEKSGFNVVICKGRDEQGNFVKLLKTL